MLWALIGILVAIWLIGLLAHVAGALINLVLVVAIAFLIVRLLTGRGSV